MDNILEFIMSNLFFIIIAFWFLSGIFKKRNAEQRKERQKEQLKEQREEQLEPYNRPSHPTPPSPIETPWEKVNQDRSAEENRAGTPARVRSKGPEVGAPEIVRLDQETSRHDRKTSLQDKKQRVQQAKNYAFDFKGINHKHVLQGMVWTQIFDRPRSQTPHRSMKYTRYGRGMK